MRKPISAPDVYAQKRKPVAPLLGWDLSYASILERNNISSDEFLSKWLAEHPQSVIKELLLGWRGGL